MEVAGKYMEVYGSTCEQRMTRVAGHPAPAHPEDAGALGRGHGARAELRAVRALLAHVLGVPPQQGSKEALSTCFRGADSLWFGRRPVLATTSVTRDSDLCAPRAKRCGRLRVRTARWLPGPCGST